MQVPQSVLCPLHGERVEGGSPQVQVKGWGAAPAKAAVRAPDAPRHHAVLHCHHLHLAIPHKTYAKKKSSVGCGLKTKQFAKEGTSSETVGLLRNVIPVHDRGSGRQGAKHVNGELK